MDWLILAVVGAVTLGVLVHLLVLAARDRRRRRSS